MPFQVAAFYHAIDRVRVDSSLTWRDVSDETSLSQSTFVRLRHGKFPDLTTFAKLIEWAELDVRAFFTKQGGEDGATLVKIVGLIHADEDLDEYRADMMERLFTLIWEALTTQ